MKIKVWGASEICKDFEELKYYHGNPQAVLVKGLKSHAQVVREAWAKRAEKYSDATDRECIMETGMTPAQYQKTYKMAWNA